MILTLQRKKPKAPGYPVLGRLTSPDGVLELRTLEDPYILASNMISFESQNKLGLNWPFTASKIPGVTAIPAGRYRCYNTWSPRFQQKLPLLVDVPGFTGIRFHSGNTAEHTEGCVIVGMEHDASLRSVLHSNIGMINLVQFVSLITDELWVDIINPLV